MSDYTNKYSVSSSQKAIIVTIFAVVFFICLIQLVFSKPMYQVKASILIQKNDLGVAQIDEFLDFNNPEVSNIVQKLKSVTLLQKTLRQLNYNFPSDSEAFLRIAKNLSVRQVPPSNVIEISLKHRALDEAGQIVNTLVETLMQEDLTERRQKINQALISVQTALTLVHNEGITPPASQGKTGRNSIDVFLKEVNEDLYKTEQKLILLQSNLSSTQIATIRDIFDPPNLDRYKAILIPAEQKLMGYLLNGGWNNRNAQNQLKSLWKEKTRIAAAFKEQFSLRSDIPVWLMDEICAYQIRRFDLKIRKQEFITLKRNTAGGGKPPLPSVKLDKPYESLKELETELIEKQTILQSLTNFTLTKINWIDKAYPAKPLLRSSKFMALGVSFGIAFIAALIAGLLCIEYNSYKRNA